MSLRIFVILLVLLTLVFAGGLAGNWIGRDGSDQQSLSREQQERLAKEYDQGGVIKWFEELMDRFTPGLELAGLARKAGCDVQASGIRLAQGNSCLIRIPASDAEIRKERLSWRWEKPVARLGTAARKDLAKALATSQPARELSISAPALRNQLANTSTAPRTTALSITYQAMGNTGKQTVKPALRESFSLVVAPKGGQLLLSCTACKRPVIVSFGE